MSLKLNILPVNLLEHYLLEVKTDLTDTFNKLTDVEISTDIFSFYTSVSSIAWCRIEGE